MFAARRPLESSSLRALEFMRPGFGSESLIRNRRQASASRQARVPGLKRFLVGERKRFPLRNGREMTEEEFGSLLLLHNECKILNPHRHGPIGHKAAAARLSAEYAPIRGLTRDSLARRGPGFAASGRSPIPARESDAEISSLETTGGPPRVTSHFAGAIAATSEARAQRLLPSFARSRVTGTGLLRVLKTGERSRAHWSRSSSSSSLQSALTCILTRTP